MKKGISVRADYDRNNRWILIIEKKKGRLTIDEIREAAKEWELDYYLLVLDCYHEEEDIQYFDDDEGDCVTLYRTDLLGEEK